MSLAKTSFPDALTNQEWQSNKGVLKVRSTGLGAKLQQLEKAYGSSLYAKGVDKKDYLHIDPFATHEKLVKIKEDLEEDKKSIQAAAKQVSDILTTLEKELKKSPAKKAKEHVAQMKLELKALLKTMKQLDKDMFDKAHEKFLKNEKKEQAPDKVEQLAQEARELEDKVDLYIKKVSSSRTRRELYNSIVHPRNIGYESMQIAMLITAPLKEYGMLIKAEGSYKFLGEGAVNKLSNLPWMDVFGVSMTGDPNAVMDHFSGEEEEPRNGEGKPSVSKIAAEYQRTLEALREFLAEVAAFEDSRLEARRNIARLGTMND